MESAQLPENCLADDPIATQLNHTFHLPPALLREVFISSPSPRLSLCVSAFVNRRQIWLDVCKLVSYEVIIIILSSGRKLFHLSRFITERSLPIQILSKKISILMESLIWLFRRACSDRRGNIFANLIHRKTLIITLSRCKEVSHLKFFSKGFKMDIKHIKVERCNFRKAVFIEMNMARLATN